MFSNDHESNNTMRFFPSLFARRSAWLATTKARSWGSGVPGVAITRCWGWNRWGQLGNGAGGLNQRETVPDQVSGIANGVHVGAGGAHTCAVLQTGEVRCWGYNAFGQLGDDTIVQKDSQFCTLRSPRSPKKTSLMPLS